MPTLAIITVSWNTRDLLRRSIQTIHASLAGAGIDYTIIVVDNGSDDDTVLRLQHWASGQQPYAPAPDIPFDLVACPKPVSLEAAVQTGPHLVRLIQTGLNLGFAGGVNRGLACLAGFAGIDRFWILNPDSVVPPRTAAALATCPAPAAGFSLMGGRVLYLDHPEIIQIDGGTVDRRTGVTGNIGLATATLSLSGTTVTVIA